jgi:hypothetical protein
LQQLSAILNSTLPATHLTCTAPAGCGFFINTYLVMLSVYVNIWVILLLALTDSYYVWVGTPGVDREVGG